MNIIGIHDGHNATVALLREGRITYAVSEERLSRVKNQGGFPARVLDRVLAETGLRPADIDKAIFTTNNVHNSTWFDRDLLLKRYRETMDYQPSAPGIKSILGKFAVSRLGRWRPKARTPSVEQRAARFRPLLERGFSLAQIDTMDHHTAHAASAYFAHHDFDRDVLCLTNDGGGDGLCGSVSIGRAGQLQRLAEIPVRNSFAALYARATFLMGMMPLEHEYKLMGLAPYADQKKAELLAKQLLSYFEWPDEAPLMWRLSNQFGSANTLSAHLKKIFYLARFDVMAAAMQNFAEEMALRWVRNCVRETKTRHLVLAGGLFMNVKLNQKILALPEVDSVYIIPSCGDESTPMGACFWGAVQAGFPISQLKPLTDLYLGPTYSEAEIQSVVKNARTNATIQIEQPESISIEEAVTNLLAQGKIVAWYQGREEFGARALGHRSILADPSRPELIRELNRSIKSRDFWMPFAGSLTDKQAQEILDNPKEHQAPYMMMTFRIKNNFEEIRAAAHPYDETIRPQVVDQSWNPAYYRLMELFEQESGKRGGILNTSFNLHGYPIVSSPADALDVFLRSGLRYLAMGPYLLRKH